MDYMEMAEEVIFDYLNERGISTEFISDAGTIDNMMNEGCSLEDIAHGKCNDRIKDNIYWI